MLGLPEGPFAWTIVLYDFGPGPLEFLEPSAIAVSVSDSVEFTLALWPLMNSWTWVMASLSFGVLMFHKALRWCFTFGVLTRKELPFDSLLRLTIHDDEDKPGDGADHVSV
ncbi:hypothetical protein DM860_001102 [Cuscuta australis]|uniref:Uncharacterized protein n=1 Tax=Cuscuta australis TaxID=267555 RepID=A0A328DSZ6_9ASTE|nr:hypothetical protein DM860_001102 [Cuscuta australis]